MFRTGTTTGRMLLRASRQISEEYGHKHMSFMSEAGLLVSVMFGFGIVALLSLNHCIPRARLTIKASAGHLEQGEAR